MGYVVSKTRSPGQILGNSCLHSGGHICDQILMKLGQNVFLGHQVKSKEILVNTLEARLATQF